MNDIAKIQSEEKGNIVLIRISGELDAYSIMEVKNLIQDYFNKGKYRIIIDCTNLEHMNSTSIGVLVGRLKEARNNGGDIRLFNLNPHLQKIFDMIGASKIFEIFLNEEEALASFNGTSN